METEKESNRAEANREDKTTTEIMIWCTYPEKYTSVSNNFYVNLK